MKKFLMSMVALFFALSATVANASPSEGDSILGVYKAVKDGAVSKVRISKNADNTYKAQVIWVEKQYNEDGSLRTDLKNPDPAKRNTPSSEIVLIESVSYEDGEWKNGKIYDPTKGDVYRVVVTFKDEKTLRVRGYFLSQRAYIGQS